MPRPLVSVVMATYQRVHLLKRSLECYRNQLFDNSKLELIIIDDHSTDGTAEYVNVWSNLTGIQTTLVKPMPKKTDWRDCGAILNSGIRTAAGEYIIITHPEVMPGRKSVLHTVNALEKFEASRKDMNVKHDVFGLGEYVASRIYYMGQVDQARIDTVNWQGEGALAVRGIDGFYDEDENGNVDYKHNVTDKVGTPGFRIKTWESWVFGGCSRRTWKMMGGMTQTVKWGSIDIAFMARRRTLGIANHTLADDETICVHQNHDLPGNVLTPRVPEDWQKELQSVNLVSRAEMMWPKHDELGWG